MQLKIAKYIDLVNIPIQENEEGFCVVNKYDKTIQFKYFLYDMDGLFDGNIMVRKKIARLLAQVNKSLKEINSDYVLSVAYGYRSQEVQLDYFNKEYSIIKSKNNNYSDLELLEETHKRIAVPSVAGHPTGGAVDITIYDSSKHRYLDMGGKIADFKDSRTATYSKNLTKDQKENRLLLLSLMKKQNFCPYYEEWWHFSYGDREWAFYYVKDNAIYTQKAVSEIIYS